MNARELLEELQKSTLDIEDIKYSYRRLFSKIIDFAFHDETTFSTFAKNTRTVFDGILHEFIENMHDNLAELPSVFQDPICYYALKESSLYIQKLLNANASFYLNDKIVTFKQIPLFGTLSQDEFSAYVHAPDSEPLILVSNGAISFGNELSMIMTQLLFKDNNIGAPIVVENLTYHPQLLRRFIEKILAYNFFTKTYYAQPHTIEQSEIVWSLHSSLVDYYNLFIFAHEYSHICLSHRVPLKNADNDEKELNYNQEYEADLLALELMLYGDTSDNVYKFVALGMVLSTLFIIDQIRNSDSLTHPKATDRIINMDKYLAKQKIKDEEAFYLTLATMNILWYELKNFLSYLQSENITFLPDNFHRIQQVLYNDYFLSSQDYESTLNQIMERI